MEYGNPTVAGTATFGKIVLPNGGDRRLGPSAESRPYNLGTGHVRFIADPPSWETEEHGSSLP